MAYCEERADRIRQALQGVEGITEQKMFGGLSFLLRGSMCCGIANSDLVVRVGPDGYKTPSSSLTPGSWTSPDVR